MRGLCNILPTYAQVSAKLTRSGRARVFCAYRGAAASGANVVPLFPLEERSAQRAHIRESRATPTSQIVPAEWVGQTRRDHWASVNINIRRRKNSRAAVFRAATLNQHALSGPAE